MIIGPSKRRLRLYLHRWLQFVSSFSKEMLGLKAASAFRIDQTGSYTNPLALF